MTQFFILRQSTTRTLPIGPFIDPTLGVPETALGISIAETQLSKNGGAFAQKTEATAPVHMSNGWYSVLLDTTDTNTVGSLEGNIFDAAAQPLGFSALVVEEAIYDALYAASATGFNSSGQVALLTATQASVDAIEADTNELQADWTNGGRLDLLIDALITEMNTATTEPGQEAPGVSIKRGKKIDYLYKAWRNKCTQTATAYKLYADDTTTVHHKSVLGSVGGTFTSNEKVTGP